MRYLLGLGAGVLIIIGGFFAIQKHAEAPVNVDTPSASEQEQTSAQPVSTYSVPQKSVSVPAAALTLQAPSTVSGKQKVYTDEELLAMADNTYADGNVPLGDNKYTTDAPKKGYIYLCNVHKDNPGSAVNGAWIHGDTWNFLEKVSVQGNVSWPQATFSEMISGASRILTGNDLPTTHTTGVFPVAASDPAHAYDPNPNTISAQTLKQTLPLNPAFSDTPYCMGGEVGIMLSGVPLFNGFDAGLRDAPAHELQDACDGHPQGSGEYHYHSLSACFKDTSVATVLGYAYDGFPITGGMVAKNKYLTTEDLDVCHGIVSEIMLDGKKVATYHYVMTQDFPYSASCFRGKSQFAGPAGGPPSGAQSGGMQNGNQTPPGGQSGAQSGGQPPAPPQEAITACTGKSAGATCAVGPGTGTCTTIGTYFACKPN
jgi:hypothetical protein